MEEQILAHLKRGERFEHFETVRTTKEGGRLHVSLSISPIKDANGRVIGASKSLVILLNESDQKRL